jgi:hypothetical protein
LDVPAGGGVGDGGGVAQQDWQDRGELLDAVAGGQWHGGLERGAYSGHGRGVVGWAGRRRGQGGAHGRPAVDDGGGSARGLVFDEELAGGHVQGDSKGARGLHAGV